MASAPQRAKVEAQVEAAVGAGAELVVGGDRAGHDVGHFFSPAVVTGAPAETDLLREETFGPVAPIVPVSSLDEAIELANGTRFGLGANVYTRDLATAVRCMREIKVGHGVDQRPADRQRRRARSAASSSRAWAASWARRGWRPSRRPSTCTSRPRSRPKEWWYPYGG